MGLLSFLISKQNCLVTSDKEVVKPTQINKLNVVNVAKSQMQNILLANTRYSFEQSGTMKEDFDLSSIESQIKKRFIQGCPRISDDMSDLPLFKFLEDKYLSLDDLLQEKIDQKPLPVSLQTQISQSLGSALPNICSFLDAVYTARSFLLVAGGDPSNHLLEYMASLHLASKTVNLMTKQLTSLELSHVDSLIKFLLLLRAKQMITNGQCPFKQIIPVEYKDELTDDLKAKVREMLVAVSQKEILSALFIFIWTQLRTPALGDQSEKPNQKLKDYLSAFSEDEEAFSKVPASLLVKHSVALFHTLVMYLQ